MDEGLVIYHVTNILGTQNQPVWDEITTHLAYDQHFDGAMVGLPVACFTTTLYKGGLPTLSTYPRSAEHEVEHWRVNFTINLNDFNLIFIAEKEGQKHVLAFRRDNDRQVMIFDLYSVARQRRATLCCTGGPNRRVLA